MRSRIVIKWAIAGLLVAATWLAYTRLLGALLYHHFPTISFYLQFAQFATWPTSIPGVIPYSWLGNWYLFMLTLIAANAGVYALLGVAVQLGSGLWHKVRARR